MHPAPDRSSLGQSKKKGGKGLVDPGEFPGARAERKGVVRVLQERDLGVVPLS